MKILLVGDSITDMGRDRNSGDQYPLAHGFGYPFIVNSRLCEKDVLNYTLINRGISGNRIVDVYARIKTDVINLKPDYMSLLIGVNDVWHELGGKQNGVDAEKFEKIYDMLIGEIVEALPNIKIMIMEPFVLEGSATVPTEEEPERWEYFSTEVPKRAAAAKRIAKKYGFPFIPLQKKLDEACRRAPASHWLRDGVHPTPMGHWLIKNEWLKAFGNL
jgi:lysophospholipase L1-like esterase